MTPLHISRTVNILSTLTHRPQSVNVNLRQWL